MTSASDLSRLATRFARLPASQRSVFMAKLAAAGIDFRLLPVAARDASSPSAPASFGQTRIWLHARMIDEPAAYHITLRLALDGALDLDALRRAFDALVARHEALRTGFVEAADGELEQRIEPPMRCPWRVTDLTQAGERERVAADVARRDEAEPFDLSRPPLVRAHVIALSPLAHWLVVTVHHIVADGWSIDVALHELSLLYGAYVEANASAHADGVRSAGPLPADVGVLEPLPIQYADYAQWQRHALAAGEAQRQAAFWCARLDADIGALTLPGSRARPMRRSAAGARHHFEIDATLGASVRALAQARRATPFAVLLAALHALLARASGDTRIQIGVPAANRARAETAGVIGCFVNTVVVPADVTRRGRFDALVDQVQAALVDAQSNEDVPFEQVVDALGVARSASHHPLFQVMASFAGRQTLPRFGEARAAVLPSELCSAKFDLALGFEAREDGGYAAAFVYALDLFDDDGVDRLARQYRQCLTSALLAPDAAIGELEWLTEDDRLALDACNRIGPGLAGEGDAAAFTPIHERIAALAAAAPDAPAVSDSHATLTRGELDALVGALARRLTNAGVGPEVRVGIAMSRSVNLFVGLLAILRAGGAFVPLDPAHPPDRLAYIVSDAGIDHVLTERAQAPKLPKHGHMRVWLVDEGRSDADIASLPSVSEPICEASSPLRTQCAYLIYTSGSTGRPKGVVVEHGPLAMHCWAIAARYGMCEGDRVLHFASINFDGAHECWMAPLAAGAQIRVTDDTLWSARQTIETMAREAITVAAFPPGYALELAEWARLHGAPASLRSLTVGGEATSREAFAALRSAFPGVRIVNGYGPTETVITPLLWMIDGGEDAHRADDAAYLPIGSPVGERSAHVLDAGMRALPVGVIGELYLGGAGVARGYHLRAALTAERFVPDPFGAAGSRLYRTGDLVRRRRNGDLEFIGRIDHQVKLRGLRIELGEIESRLIAHPQVRDAVALVRGKDAEASVFAYVELADAAGGAEAPADGAALAAFVRETLPDYMVPARIVVLPRLPRNANRKIDRAALPEPAAIERVFAAPAPGIETALALIWREVLKTEHIGRTDDFFSIGGHSLKAVAVATRVAERLGRDVPIRALFEAPTLAAYAQRVREASPRLVEPRAPGAADALHDASLRSLQRASALSECAPHGCALSDEQASLWYLWRAPPTTPSHHIAMALRLRGRLDVPALAQAIGALTRRHPALRTGIVDVGCPTAVVASYREIDVPLIDLRSQGHAHARLQQACRLTDEDALRPFEMSGKALWRARLLRLGDDDHVLSFVIHHAVADGRSIAIWLSGLRRGYERRTDAAMGGGTPATAPSAPPVPMEMQTRRPPDEASAAYWRAQLLDTPALSLPAPSDTRRGPAGAASSIAATQASWGATRMALAFDDPLVRRARTVAHQARASLPMLMHAALNVALARALGALDQPIGTLASTRDAKVEDEIGLFVQTLIVRTKIDERASVRDVLTAVRDATLSAYEHMATPLTHVLSATRGDDSNGERTDDGHPLLAALFNFVRSEPEPTHWGALAVEPFNDVRRRMLFELELDIVEDANGGLGGALSFAHERVDGAFARRLVQMYYDAFAQLACSPNTPVVTAAARPSSIERYEVAHASEMEGR